MSTTRADPVNTRTMAATSAEIKARVDATKHAKKEPQLVLQLQGCTYAGRPSY